MLHDVNILKNSMEEAQQDIDYLQKELNKLKDKFGALVFPSMDDFNVLKHRMDKLESSNSSLKMAYGNLEKELKGRPK